MTLPARDLARDPTQAYRIDIDDLKGTVTAWHGDTLLARSDRAKVMYETRLAPVVYFPVADVRAEIIGVSALQTFCPFKGTAGYRDLRVGDSVLPNALWCYEAPLPESRRLAGYAAFMPEAATRIDTGGIALAAPADGDPTGPLVNWLLREAPVIATPEDLARSFSHKLIEQGVAVSRVSVMIWSLHPLIAGRNHVWTKTADSVDTYAPDWEIHDRPAFINSPLRHVTAGLGGVRQRLADTTEDSFPILRDLRDQGATDYVAMPMPFSDGRMNVLTLTCDHPDGFSTADLGLVFECSRIISRLFEVFSLRENAQALLETYVGKRTGARVLGGEIRRGDGDEIDAAIMFCDLRGSTRLEETLGRAAYIDLLNDFFETVSTLVEDAGGEVLKFIGDAVLAVFPADPGAQAACQNALTAANRIIDRLSAPADGPPLACAIGLAFGRVMYGNVGSRERLDFTVIGQAANIAARLGDHGKTEEHAIVTTEQFCAQDCPLQPLGEVRLHNVSRPVAAFAAAAPAAVPPAS